MVDYSTYRVKKIFKCLKIAAEEMFIPKMTPEIEIVCPKTCLNLKEIDGEYYCVWKLNSIRGNPLRHELCPIKDIKVDESKTVIKIGGGEKEK